MNVIIDVVDAEAVIPRTAGTVAEFEIGILGIRPSADGALVVIELLPLLPADLPGGFAEVDG